MNVVIPVAPQDLLKKYAARLRKGVIPFFYVLCRLQPWLCLLKP